MHFHFLNNNYAKTGLVELQKEVDSKIIDSKKTFTICQYDDGPVINLQNTIQFLASKKGAYGIPIPLLCSNHKIPLKLKFKRNI